MSLNTIPLYYNVPEEILNESLSIAALVELPHIESFEKYEILDPKNILVYTQEEPRSKL